MCVTCNMDGPKYKIGNTNICECGQSGSHSWQFLTGTSNHHKTQFLTEESHYLHAIHEHTKKESKTVVPRNQ